MDNLKDILNQQNKDIDNQKLMDYLNGKLSAEEEHEMEMWMQESELASDAVEGLQEVDQQTRLDLITYDLNRKLKQQLHLKNERRNKRKIPNFGLTVLVVVVILALCVLGYIVIRMNSRGG